MEPLLMKRPRERGNFLGPSYAQARGRAPTSSPCPQPQGRHTDGRPAEGCTLPPRALNGRPGPRKGGLAADRPRGKFPEGRGGGSSPGRAPPRARPPRTPCPAGGGQPFSRALPPSLPGLLLSGGGAQQPGAVTAAQLLLLAPLGGHGRGSRRVHRVAGRRGPPEVAAPAPPRGPAALRPAPPRHDPRVPGTGPAPRAPAGAPRRGGGQAAGGGPAAAGQRLREG